MASRTAEPTGSITTAIAHARRMLATRPDLAIEQADEILRVVPRHPETLVLLGDAWRARGNQLHLAGDEASGDAAHMKALNASIADPALLRPADALARNDLPVAEGLLRERLKQAPTDVGAIRMLAELAGRIGRHRDAENLLRRAIELAPGFAAARHNLALLLHRHGHPAEALVQIDRLIAGEPDNITYTILRAAILGRLGDYDAAIIAYRAILDHYPRQAKVWMSMGHALKTVGRQSESVAAYRRSLTLEPTLGSSWWSLANLKTFRFTPEDVTAMQNALTVPGIDDEDRYQLEFALGKACEDAGEWQASFTHYAAANRSRRAKLDYDPAHVTAIVDRQRATLDADFFAARKGWGCPAADPIFVVSLPRSGSTLIEQILASHSQVEGTMELPDIGMIAGQLGPGGIMQITESEARAMGEDYLARTAVQRKEGRPHFVDKMPNNWTYLALIHLILPNARIVDARRHPLGCGWSLFKQHFARGQSFSYDLDEIGRYYRDYVRALDHVDHVLPGRVHRVFYEAMVDDNEAQVRALIDAVGLPFEEACLRFHETERAVRTASSEQVRRPIFREGLDQWRHFEPWLGPLANALGPVLTAYPDVPSDA
jgi:tetratricopeptide (TPR) repeat protein